MFCFKFLCCQIKISFPKVGDVEVHKLQTYSARKQKTSLDSHEHLAIVKQPIC